MKKMLPVLAIIFLIFLLVTAPWKRESGETVTTSIKLVEVNRLGGAMAVFREEEGNSIYFLGLSEAVFIDEKGESASFQDLRPGMILDMEWNGRVKESFPLSVDATSLTVTGQEEDLVGLYLAALTDFWKSEAAYTEKAAKISLTLADAGALTEGERTALAYLASCKVGYIDYAVGEDGPFEEDTVSALIRGEGEEDGKRVFTLQLQRGALDPVSARYTASVGEDGRWLITPDS